MKDKARPSSWYGKGNGNFGRVPWQDRSEKSEWSEILARELQTHGQLKSQLEELNTKTNQKGWNPFRRDR